MERENEKMYNAEYGAYIGKNPVKWYRVLIWDFDIRCKAGSRGAARYETWLNFNDAYDIPFGEFCKQSKVMAI